MERSTIVIQQLILWLSLLVRLEWWYGVKVILRLDQVLIWYLVACSFAGLRLDSAPRCPDSLLSLVRCSVLPLRRRSPSLPLSRAELLSYCCPILEVRWVGQLLALCLGLAAKSYNIAGRRKFCCRAIILLGEGNSVVLSYSRDAIYKYAYHILY